MVSTLPVRLLRHNNGEFSVVDPQTHPGGVASFDIVSYRWGEEVDPYSCDIHGVTWNVKISQEKLNDLKRLMVANESKIQYLWADCVCIYQGNEQEKFFSAVSLRPRECKMKADVFRGLLGVFSGLFTPGQIQVQMSGTDIDAISFAFFKQLSLATGYAWTRLAISSSKRDAWNWIPVMPTPPAATVTTDCFAGVLRIGRLKENGRVEAPATVGLEGVPRQYMSIAVRQGTEGTGLQFRFWGCNCGRKVKSGIFSSEHIPVNDHSRQVTWEETGRTLVECATLLGSIMDPAGGVVEYRKRLLHKMQPQWNVDDPSAKPAGWVDRCVSGTWWENPDEQYIRIHNRSVHYDISGVTGCESRLDNKSTAGVMCEVRVSCGCFLVAPFWLVMGGLTAVELP